ncbi:hypothetical protein FACS189492_0420 [Clostridia bacterium]|nr:hypothetical protein FACS189492_0420 [Clostridia bacterium]
MGENAKKTGDKLEQFGGNYLMTKLGWQELLRDYEIKCSRSSHKNSKDGNKLTHGIDLLCKFDDPYSRTGQAVVIECKNWQMQSINATSVGEWVMELINNIDCAQSAPELQNVGVDTSVLATGLLLIHANDRYDEKKMETILQGISAPNRRMPINVFIATNREIYMWTSLFNEIDRTFKDSDFDFVYPSINESSKVISKHIPINALFSRFLFAQHTYAIDFNDGNRKGTEQKSESVLFSFDDISLDSFRYIWSMFKYYQMEGTNSYIFYFYPRKSEDVQLITAENFINAIAQDDADISDITKSKIQVKILDNRELSPVDTKKGETL